MKKDESIKNKSNTFTNFKNKYLSTVIKKDKLGNKKELNDDNKKNIDNENDNLYGSLFLKYSSDSYFTNRKIEIIRSIDISKCFVDIDNFRNIKIKNYFEFIIIISTLEYHLIDPKLLRYIILILPLFHQSSQEEILSFTKNLIDKSNNGNIF